jgi:hypothetical protein
MPGRKSLAGLIGSNVLFAVFGGNNHFIHVDFANMLITNLKMCDWVCSRINMEYGISDPAPWKLFSCCISQA